MLLQSLSTVRNAARRWVGDRHRPIEPEIDINITEPAVFIPTYTSKPAVLRGTCVLRVKHSLVVKRLSVSFNGISHVQWPYGRHDLKTLTGCTLVLSGPGIPVQQPALETCEVCETCTEKLDSTSKGAHTTQKKCRLWNMIVKRLWPNCTQATGLVYQAYSPGSYEYNFEMVLPSDLPESLCIRRSNVRYNIEASMERPGCMRRKLTRSKPITAVHCPAEDFVEDVEPVFITRRWRSLLRCEILLSKRGAPLGGRLPVTVSLTELAGAKYLGLKIYLSENTQYLQKDGRVSYLGPFKRLLMYDTMDDFVPMTPPFGVGSDDDHLQHMSGEDLMHSKAVVRPVGNEGMVLDIDLSLPRAVRHTHLETSKLDMHFDTRYQNVQVNHWLEFVFFLSKNRPSTCTSTDAPSVQKTAKAPLALRSCYAHPANASLPTYSRTCDSEQPCIVSPSKF